MYESPDVFIYDGYSGSGIAAAVKSPNIAAVASDPALVVAISPNNSLSISGSADATATGSLGALNATVQLAVNGENNAAMQLVAGTLVGTIVPEVSVDGGTTWVSIFFDDPSTSNVVSSIVFGSNNTATTRTIVSTGGASHVRVRVSAYTSGTATCNLRASVMQDPTLLSGGAAGSALPPVVQQIGGSVTTASPGYSNATINALSLTTAGALRIDGSAVTQPISGTVTANQGTSPWVSNITQFGSVNISTGTGASGTGIPRVTVSNDSNIIVSQATAANLNATVVQSTAANLRTQTASEGTTATTAPTVIGLIGGTVQAVQSGLTVGDIYSLSMTATGLLRVDGSNVTQPVSGTVAVTQSTSPWVDNITQFGSVNISTGTGASGTGIPRVTVSNDSNILATQSGTWTVQQGNPPWAQNLTQIAGNAVSTAASGVQKVGVVGNTNATIDATLASGTAPTNGLGTLAQYNTSQPAPTNTQTLSLQSDQSGNLLTFPGVQTKTGAVWNSSTSINTLQYPTGTTTVGAPLGAQAYLVQLDQTTTLTGGAVTFQGTYDGTNWVTIPTAQVLNPQTFASLSNPYTFAASTNQPFLISLQGFQQIRLNLTTLITGTGAITPYWTGFISSPLASINEVQGMASSGSTPIGNPVYIGGKDSSGNVQPIALAAEQSQLVTQDTNRQVVQSNATVTTSSSTILGSYGNKEITLFINVKSAPTGTLPTLTYTIQEVDPGDQTTVLGTSTTGAALNAAGVQILTLSVTTSGFIKVSWVIGGSASPTFTGVYATLVTKLPGVMSGVDSNGVQHPLLTDSSGNLKTNVAPVTGGAIAFGDVNLSLVTTAAVERTTYTEQSSNFTGSVKSSSASDAAAGTGLRTLTITYLDSTGAGPNTETVTLNGTTAVNLVNSNHCFIEKILATTVGSTGSNVGTISLFTGAAGAGTLVATIAVNDNRTFWTHHYTPLGKTTYITGTLIANTSSTVGAGATYAIKTLSYAVANSPEEQVGDTLTLYGQSSMTPRLYTTAIPLATGPARVRMYVTTLSSTNQTYRASFDYYDQ